jgi:hypothetical protein
MSLKNLKVEQHQLQYLQGVTHYNADDEFLAAKYPKVYDKLRLCQALGQDATALPAGEYIHKPRWSYSGLDFGVCELSLGIDTVVQPRQEAAYANVDAIKVGSTLHYWVWTAVSKSRPFFDYFKYNGYCTGLLSEVQRQKLLTILDLVDELGIGVNVEFLGDYAIESHVRLSLGLSDLPRHAGDPCPVELVTGVQQPLVVSNLLADYNYYSVPIWVDESEKYQDPWLILDALNEFPVSLLSFQWLWGIQANDPWAEPIVAGKKRVCVLNLMLPSSYSIEELVSSLRATTQPS